MDSAECNALAQANNRPLQSTSEGAALPSQIDANIGAYRNAAGVLPPSFFTVPLPANFWGMNANSFDITTIQEYMYYRLRQQLGTAGQVHAGRAAECGSRRPEALARLVAHAVETRV